MRGKWIYVAFIALTGMLAAFNHIVVFLLLFATTLVFFYKRKKFSSKELYFIGFIFLVFYMRSEWVEQTTKTKLLGDEKSFYMYVQDDLKIDGDMLSASGKDLIRKEKLVVRYKLNSENEKQLLMEKLKIGMVCKVTGNLEQPMPASNQNAFNYQEYLHRNSVFWLLKIDRLDPQMCKPHKKTFLSFFQTLRQDGIFYVTSKFPQELAPLAVALLFGERDFIDSDILKSYQKLGIVHLLAISGLHVGMLAGMFYFVGIRAGITREKMTTTLILVLPCYAIITGAAPSVIRAVWMMMLFLILRKWGDRLSLQTIDIISIVFVSYTFFSPYVIYEVGFQLSFCVSIALILSAPILLKRFSHPVSLLFMTSFICQLAATPILFYYFYEASLVSAIANVLYVPLFSLVLLPTLIIIFLFHLLFGTTIQFLLTPINVFVAWMDSVTELLGNLPFTTITLGRPNLFTLILYIIVFSFFFSSWEKRKGRKHFFKVALLPVFVLFIHSSENFISPYGEITFIDVGQGDSIFIKLPHAKGNYLIDTGGTLSFHTEDWKMRQKQFDVGKDIVVPFLKSKGVTKIHKLILTHGDMDHIGGATEVMKELSVKEVILPASPELSGLEKEILLLAMQQKIPYKFTQAGDSFVSANQIFYILSPQNAIEDNRNNGSIVIYSELGGLSWLFTGDLEKEGEEQLVQTYNHLKIDVLKVGHHGSKTSTSEILLNKIEPKLAVISAGRNNRYGHPNSEVVNLLQEKNIQVLRTDKHGAITYIFRKDNGTFSMQLP